MVTLTVAAARAAVSILLLLAKMNFTNQVGALCWPCERYAGRVSVMLAVVLLSKN
jgi:hypothetical protein